MPHERSILVYGNSLFMDALEAGLHAVRGFHLQRIGLHNGNLLDAVRAEPPDFIIFELASMQDQTAFTLLKEFPGVDLIGLDAESHRLLLLSVEQQMAPDTADLIRLIEMKGVAAQKS